MTIAADEAAHLVHHADINMNAEITDMAVTTTEMVDMTEISTEMADVTGTTAEMTDVTGMTDGAGNYRRKCEWT